MASSVFVISKSCVRKEASGDNLRANRSILKTFIYRGNIFNKTVNLSYGPHTDITLIQCNYKYTLYNTIGLQCGMLTTNVF